MNHKLTFKSSLGFLFLAVFLLAFLSCQKPNPGDLNLKSLEGKATKEDIKAIFGSPDSVTEDKGETLYLYIIKHKEKVESFEYNPASGQWGPTSKTLRQWEEIVLMRFDRQGILRYWRVEKM